MTALFLRTSCVAPKLLACMACLPLAAFAAPGTITTVAGIGGSNFNTGDGGPATAAMLAGPRRIALSNNGDIYITTRLSIRKVAASSGIITTVVSNDALAAGFSGDGGPASNAQIASVTSVDLDSAGNLYIADGVNARIRVVSVGGNGILEPSDIISTLFTEGQTGTFPGAPGSTAVALINPSDVEIRGCGDLFVSDAGAHRIFRTFGGGSGAALFAVTGTGTGGFNGEGVTTKASLARVNNPQGVFCAPAPSTMGFLFVADAGNARLRRVQLDSDFITTSAGNGVQGSSGDGGLSVNAQLAFPNDVAVDNAGDVYIADTAGRRVRRIDGTTSIITTFAGTGNNPQSGQGGQGDGGPATAADLSPRDVVVGAATGNVFILETANSRVRKVEGPDTAGPLATVTINSGAAQANNPNVTLSLVCTDSSGSPGTPNFKAGSGCVQMRFSNDGGATWGPWIASASTAPWILSAGDGVKTVRAQFMDGVGLLSAGTSTDSIILNTLLPLASNDFNADNHADILWRHRVSGNNALWFMVGRVASKGPINPVIQAAQIIQGIGDFDGDFHVDIFWRNTNLGSNSIWLMNGRTPSTGPISATAPSWVIGGVGDFDGDGMADILWRNGVDGRNSIWLMNGRTVSFGATIQVANLNIVIAGVADFDGNGTADILWRNLVNGVNPLWLMNGRTPSFGTTSQVANLDLAVVQTSDFDGDGMADILWRNFTTGSNSIWLMNGRTASFGATSPVADLNWEVVP